MYRKLCASISLVVFLVPSRNVSGFHLASNQENETDIGAVIDATGSMDTYRSLIGNWVNLTVTKELVQYFAFFNDGDGVNESVKMIGSTGMKEP